MAYSVKSKKSGKTYFLHGREQSLRGGHVQTIYFFAAEPKDGVRWRVFRKGINWPRT